MAPLDLKELWIFRELFLFLSWRDLLVRYKQTYLGVLWAVLQPLLTVVVFTVIFGKLGRFPNRGVAYPLLTMAAILPWQFFANALSEGSNSLVASARIISKVYFPRLIVPASSVLSGTVDFLIGLAILAIMMFCYNLPYRAELLLLPLFFGFALLAAFSVAVWMSALNVKYRDVKYVVPFFTRMGIYVSPVGFLTEVIPEKWRFLYSLNPMVGVIDGFRWCILGPGFEPYLPGLFASFGIVVFLAITGLFHFRATERTFADIV